MYPALAVLQALGGEANPVLWVGSEGGMEEALVTRNKIDFTAIPAAQVHGISLTGLPRNLRRIWQGVHASRRILRQFQPDVILFTGGYVAVPMALAGHAVPILLYVPDIEPGLALKALAYFSDRIAVTTEDSLKYFRHRKRISVTGYPTRANLLDADPIQARRMFGMREGCPVLLVAGGSKGARSINRALTRSLAEILSFTQVIHITGEADWPEIQPLRATLPADLAASYYAVPYLHEMGAALAAADLVVSRAGASTLGEYPLFGLPAVLVPYPYHWRYQKVNAEYLIKRQAAVMIENDHLETELLSTVRGLLADPARLKSMRISMHSMAQPAAATRIASLITSLAGRTG